ncbi:hypothetical protein BREVNS_2151 [Brevinematales bacterium NS]|nr:hypothetical protein BREVNS_2151 [Brevinematales bacterium NS]
MIREWGKVCLENMAARHGYHYVSARSGGFCRNMVIATRSRLHNLG